LATEIFCFVVAKSALMELQQGTYTGGACQVVVYSSSMARGSLCYAHGWRGVTLPLHGRRRM